MPHYHDPERISIGVLGGETSPLWKTSDYAYMRSASVDYWRPGMSAENAAAAGCDDGTCGLPDPGVEYDD